jgi:hypothetical protein
MRLAQQEEEAQLEAERQRQRNRKQALFIIRSMGALGNAAPPSLPSSTQQAPPLPRAAFRVGIVGSRELGSSSDAQDRLRDFLTQVFTFIACELHSLKNSEDYYDKKRKPLLRVVTGLAAGADQIAARAALDASKMPGVPAELELLAIIPFKREEYITTMEVEKDKDEFNALLGEATTQVLVLDGHLEQKKPAETETQILMRKRRRQRAYRAQGWFLRQQSDLLLAIWNPMKEGNPGGTEDTMRRALYSGLPVAWIDPARPNRQLLLTHAAELEVLLNDGDPLELRPKPPANPTQSPEASSGVTRPSGSFLEDLRQRGVRQLLQSSLPSRRSHRWAAPPGLPPSVYTSWPR